MMPAGLDEGAPPDDSVMNTDLQQVLERYWGYTSFRPLQHEAMEAVLARPRFARRAADRRRQVALLPGARPGAPGPRRRRLAAHLADEGPGRHARRQRRAGGLLQQLAVADEKRVGVGRHPRRGATGCSTSRPSGSSARAATGFLALLRRASRQRSSPSTRRTASASGGTTSGRSTGSSARLRDALAGRQPPRLHGDRHRARAARHRRAARSARSARAGRLVRPAESRSTACCRGRT